MRIIKAVNHKGKVVIGMGRTAREAGFSIIASTTRSEAEQAEQTDLSSAVSCLVFLEEIGVVEPQTLTETEFWRLAMTEV